MFEKYTERARKIMSLARQEAQRLNSEFIGTEHILLGVVREGGGVAAKVLQKFQADHKKIIREIEKLITPSTSPTVTLGQLPFSPRAKRVMELSAESANQLQHDVIGTEHILLGLLKEKEGIAAQVLTKMDVGLEVARDQILEILGAEIGPDSKLHAWKFKDKASAKATSDYSYIDLKTWKGKPLEDLTKPELIEALTTMVRMYRDMVKIHGRTLDLL